MQEPKTIFWIIDTSSICQVRRSVQNVDKPGVFRQMSGLADSGRLLFTKQVVEELERVSDTASPDAQLDWAKRNQANATLLAPSLDEVKEVLAQVASVLDPEKDSGAEEADPYLLALAVKLRREGKDARMVTEEKKDLPGKMSLSTAAGLLGVPSVPLRAFLEFEKIL